MTKRMLALVLSLMLFIPAALAQEDTIASYALPDGAEVCYVTDVASLAVPDGLQPMYDLMQQAVLRGDVYVLRMPCGRALASVSSTPVRTTRSAEELLSMWPQIAANIAKEVVSVNDDASCAQVEEVYGTQALHITTDLTVGENTVVLLKAEAFAFCTDNSMVEVWAVWPDEAMYRYDEQAAKELESDVSDLQFFLKSLNFSGEANVLQGSDYTDPEGRFTLKLPDDFIVVTSATPADELESIRQQFLSANAEGADAVFNSFVEDITEHGVTLLLTGDMKGAVTLFCAREPDFAGVTADMMATLAQPIRQMQVDRFGIAILLDAEERVMVSGAENTLLGYWVRSGECSVQLDVMAAVHGSNWLCEADIYTLDGDQSVRALLSTLIVQTLTFTVD